MAGLPAGQARARMLQGRATIVDTKMQRRANTVWNRQIHSQLPVTTVPPLPAAPGRGGGNKRWVRRRGGREVGAGVIGVLFKMLGQGMNTRPTLNSKQRGSERVEGISYQNAMFPTDAQQDRCLPSPSEARRSPRDRAPSHAGGWQINAWFRAS